MTVRGFVNRLVYLVLFTWILGSIFDSVGWALYFAFVLLTIYEVFRDRRPQGDDEQELNQDL